MSISGRALWLGVRDVAPMLLGVIPFGLVTGVGAVAIGLSDLQAVAMSAMVYAGVAQVAAFEVIDSEAPLPVVLLTVLMVNLRLIMYSAAIAPWLRPISLPVRALLAFMLTDQAFVFGMIRFAEDQELSRRDYILGISGTMWLVWVVATAVGALFGARLPDDWSLDFAIPLVFVALLIPSLRDRPTWVAALTAAGVALAAAGLPYNLGLVLAALCGVVAGVASERTPAAR